MPDDADDTVGAVEAAMEVVKSLLRDENLVPPAELWQALQDEAARESLLRGFSTLIYVFISRIDDPTSAVPPLIRKLSALAVVPRDYLPTLTGALMAAALKQSPVRCRQALGPVEAREVVAWAVAAWLVADLLDFGAGEGATERMMAAVLAHLDTTL